MGRLKLLAIFLLLVWQNSVFGMILLLPPSDANSVSGLPWRDVLSDDDEFDTDGSAEAEEKVGAFIQVEANPSWSESVDFASYGFDFLKKGNLYIFAFDVGQANFIVLRKGNAAVIVDAGVGKNALWPQKKATKLLESIHIDAVFITHPHDDHFSLLIEGSPIKHIFRIDKKTHFFLGGLEKDWTERPAQPKEDSEKHQKKHEKPKTELATANKLKTLALGSEYHFCERDTLSREYTFMEDVAFKMVESRLSAGSSANRKSFILNVSYADNNVLFTGDAEGEGVERIMRPAADIKHVIKLAEMCHSKKICSKVDSWKNKAKTSLASAEFWGCYDEINEFTDNLLSVIPSEKRESLQKEWTKHAGAKEMIQRASLIFLPHHGTRTEYSQRWIGIAGNLHPHCFVISSSPFGLDRIPKRSTIEFIHHNPSVPSHPILYCRDTLEKSVSKVASVRITHLPVYVTGAAPGGVECFLLSQDHPGVLQKFDVFKRKDSKLYRWLDIIVKESRKSKVVKEDTWSSSGSDTLEVKHRRSRSKFDSDDSEGVSSFSGDSDSLRTRKKNREGKKRVRHDDDVSPRLPFTDKEIEMGYTDAASVLNVDTTDEGLQRFRIIDVRGDGACGYYALGMTREDAACILIKNYLNNPEISHMLSLDVQDAVLHGHLSTQIAVTSKHNNAQEEFSNAQKKVTECLKGLNVDENDLENKSTDTLITEYSHANGLPNNLNAAYNAFIAARTVLADSFKQINANARISATIKEYIDVYVRQSTADFQNKFPHDNNWLNITGHTINALAIALNMNIIVVNTSGFVTHTFNKGGKTTQYIEYDGFFHFRRLEPLHSPNS